MIAPTGERIRRLLGQVIRPVVVFVLYDTCVAFAFLKLGWNWLSLPHIPLSIFGGALGAIVAFRNTSSYARWWEARTLWGHIVNHSRSLARQVLSIPVPPEYDDLAMSEILCIQRRIITLQIAYVHALRCQLRGLPPWDDLKRLLPVEDVQGFRQYRNVAVHTQQKSLTYFHNVLRTGGSTASPGRQWTGHYRSCSTHKVGRNASRTHLFRNSMTSSPNCSFVPTVSFCP
jgi:ion channel-forming bestrophin family protein